MGLHFRPAKAALPQIRIETVIGSQANYEIKINITIYFYEITISYEKYLSVKWQHCLAPHKLNKDSFFFIK